VVSDVHTIERLAEFGIVFFLFEMGIELSLERLVPMKRDVFGLGLAQMGLTAAGAATLAPLVMPGLTPASRAVVGSGLALSSSAFVLQLLRDKDDMNTRHGRAAFGILLFQDLSVVPLLVAIPLLSGGTKTVIAACRAALIKSVIALGTIAFVGRFVLEKIFLIAAKSKSQEAFLALILLTVTGMSILTEGLGLSNTLGAFLAGVLLSETKYRYQVEADIAPFRGLLLGLFFITVGFSIDCSLLVREAPRVVTIVTCLTALKALTITVLCKLFKMSTSQGMQAGLLLAQGGEFAFVAFRLAESLGILTGHQAKTLLTSTAITMACTPGMYEIALKVGQRMEQQAGFSHYVGSDEEAEEIKKDLANTPSDQARELVVVCGYGRIGKVVCEVLDRKFIRYVVFEVNPSKVIEARNRGLPVFFGDVSRPEVLQNFNVGNAKMVITALSDRHASNVAILTLKRLYPGLPILARAVDVDHQKRLQSTLGVSAMVPVLPEDSLLLNLPFGGAVLKSLGYPIEEVDAILEDVRKKAVDDEEEGAAIEVQGEEEAMKVKGLSKKQKEKQKPGDEQLLLATGADGEPPGAVYPNVDSSEEMFCAAVATAVADGTVDEKLSIILESRPGNGNSM
jgi:Kef-type K+ transport system membrane component KefB/voltage-gated potassium channel Kch